MSVFGDGRGRAARAPGAADSDEARVKVAIIGGGCAAISTAFDLSRPEHAGRYDITVYQVGWRLGGKGASGRGVADRIEEHGFHVWMGFYENAFRLLRECYDELDRDPLTCRITQWHEAFEANDFVGVVDRDRDGSASDWTAHFPPMPGLPGDPDSATAPSVADYLARTTRLLATLLESLEGSVTSESGHEAGSGTPVADRAQQLVKFGIIAGITGLVEAVRVLESLIAYVSPTADGLALRVVEEIAASARRQLEIVAHQDEETRRLWTLIDLLLSILRGALRFGLLTDPRGLDSIDTYDWREWLKLNGASDASVNSSFMAGNYALMFAYEGGDPDRPRMAAGQALRGAFRMFFTYRGSLFWKMRAGMGDVIFAPYYEVLRRRGVRFEFFHRLEHVRITEPSGVGDDERSYVTALEFDVQAEVAHGVTYEPLVDVGGLPCWPSQPDFGQLVDGERLAGEGWDFESWWDRRSVATKTLKVGDDFDAVVLGVGLGAIPHVAGDIVARDARWREMVERVGTVSTQALQLWTRPTVQQLGWHEPGISISAFVQPFETWADMPQLLHEENWPTTPGSVAYFCGVLPDAIGRADRDDANHPQRRRAEVRANAVDFLDHHIGYFWPNAVTDPGGFRWDLLCTPSDSADAGPNESSIVSSDSLDNQFYEANVNPSDRYVLSLPDTARSRISPLDMTYDNLTLAGDWTDCGHNAGCVEAAVMSGRLAAHAISGVPRLQDIVGYDHP